MAIKKYLKNLSFMDNINYQEKIIHSINPF